MVMLVGGNVPPVASGPFLHRVRALPERMRLTFYYYTLILIVLNVNEITKTLANFRKQPRLNRLQTQCVIVSAPHN